MPGLEDILESHQLFKGSTEPETVNPKEICSKLAYHKDVGLVFCERGNIRVISVTSPSPDEYQTLVPHPSLPSVEITGLFLNQTASLLAVVGGNKLSVLTLDSKIKLGFERKEGRVSCRSRVLETHSRGSAIRKVAWHPLGASHLVVLTDDCLSIYNASHHQTSQPEQFYRILARREGSRAVSFAFGGASHVDSWQKFVIYILMDTGEIYALCPIVPFDCLLPKSQITTLEEKTENLIRDTRNYDHIENYQREQRWLKNIQGSAVLVDYSTPTGIKRVDQKQTPTRRGQGRFHARRSGSVYSLHDSDSSSDEDDNLEPSSNADGEGWITTKRPPTFDTHKVSLQGPLNIIDETVTGEFESSDLICLPLTPTILVRSYVDTLLEIFLMFEDIHPQWTGNQVQPDEPPMILYERIDLGLPIISSKPTIPACRLERGIRAENNFFAHHGSGVHHVTLRWAEKLQEHIFSRPEEPVPNLETAEVTWLLNTLPLREDSDGYMPFTGFTIVSGANITPIAIALDNYKVNINETKLDEKIPEKAIAESAKVVIELPKTVPKITSLPFTLDPQSPKTLVYLTGHTNFLLQNNIKEFEQLHMRLISMVERIQEDSQIQSKQVEDAGERLSEMKEKQIVFEKTMTEMKEQQATLTTRANALLAIVNSLRGRLSKAEMQYHRDLQDNKAQADAFEEALKKLEDKVKPTLQMSPRPSGLTRAQADQLRRIEPQLADQGDRITNMVQRTDILSSDVQKLHNFVVL